MPGYLPPGHFLAVFDPDGDGDDDATAAGDTDHDRFSPDGSIVSHGASGLPQVQEVVDPDNQPVPEHDDLPTGVMFPVGDNAPASGSQWSAGPGGPKARTAAKADLEPGLAEAMAQADAANGRGVQSQADFPSNRHQHGKYLRTWNNLAGLMHGLTGTGPMGKDEYGKKTGRPDLHPHYLAAYAQGYAQAHSPRRADDGGQVTAGIVRRADAWSEPRKTTDDFDPPYNSPQTSPQPWSANAAPQDPDYAAGHSAGQSDRSAGEHPLFSDNSSGVSPYVKGYAEGYGGAQAPQGQQDVPLSMGGDSGQGVNAQEAQRSFQVARASRTAAADPWKDARDNLETRHDVEGGHDVSGAPGGRPLPGEGTGGREGATWKTSSLRRVSASFAPDSLMGDPEFRKGYLFASRWKFGQRLVSQGSARFEAGLYAGITDRPQAHAAWLSEHAALRRAHPELGRRIALHASFTRKQGQRHGIYVSAGTMTDLVTDGPGTSPDPMGATPLNGPGAPPPMGGLSQPAAPGGAPPYQGTAPLPGGPVVPDDVMGKPQQAPEPSGPFTNTFSGQHPENALLAPAAPNTADSSGYTNPQADAGNPHKTAAFRQVVQAGLARMGAK